MRKFQNYQVSYLKLKVSDVVNDQIRWDNLQKVRQRDDLYQINTSKDCYRNNMQFYYYQDLEEAEFTIQVPLFCYDKIDCMIGHFDLIHMKDVIMELTGVDISDAYISQITCSAFEYGIDNELIQPFLNGHVRVSRWDDNSTISVLNVSDYVENKEERFVLRYDVNYFDVSDDFTEEISFLDCIRDYNFQIMLTEPFAYPISTEMTFEI